MYKIFIVGVSGPEPATIQKQALGLCRVIIAAKRYQETAATLAKKIVNITPLDQALDLIASDLKHGNVGVIAGGDPLFFGIAKTLLGRFRADIVEIIPDVSSLQLACARFKIPWDDARVVSLHGRKNINIVPQLLLGTKTIIFTDNRYQPALLAKTLRDYLDLIGARQILAGMRMYVGENLGTDNERLVKGNLDKIILQTFSTPNIVILQRRSLIDATTGPLGLRETEISHPRGLITKDEVRAVTLHKLNLPRTGVFWDIGAGSGSISMEAGRLCPEIDIFSVEKQEGQLEKIRSNIVAFETFNIVPISGVAPEALQDLPTPDRIFIGGSGGKLPLIISAAAEKLNNRGKIVLNAVTRETREAGPDLLTRLGFHVDIVEVNVSRFLSKENKQHKINLNPIAIITGKK